MTDKINTDEIRKSLLILREIFQEAGNIAHYFDAKENMNTISEYMINMERLISMMDCYGWGLEELFRNSADIYADLEVADSHFPEGDLEEGESKRAARKAIESLEKDLDKKITKSQGAFSYLPPPPKFGR